MLEKMRDFELCIDILSETEVNVRYIRTASSFDSEELVSFNYKDGFIFIDGNWEIVYHKYISIDDRDGIEENAGKLLSEEIKLLELFTVLEIKRLSYHYDIANCYPYGFNRISCINTTTGVIENVRLSPYYNILNDSKQANYNCIGRYQKHGIVYDKERNRCIAVAQDRHGLGPAYELSSTYMTNATEETTWIPICSLEQSTQLPFNKFVYLKDIENQEIDTNAIIYLSAKGMLYNGNAMLATLAIPDLENIGTSQRISIKYQTDDASFEISMLETGELAIEQTDADNNKTTKKYIVEKTIAKEKVSDHPELSLLSSKVSILSEGKIYDGTQFEPMLSTRTKERLLAEEQDELFKQEHPILAFVISNWKIILGVILFLLWILFME